MAFPASQATLSDGLHKARSTATAIANQVRTQVTQSQTGPVPRARILLLTRLINNTIAEWDTMAALPGLAAYAQAQYADDTLNIAAEFSAMRAAAIVLRDWINANFPKDAGGNPIVFESDAGGGVVDLFFQPAELAAFRTQANIFLATIG